MLDLRRGQFITLLSAAAAAWPLAARAQQQAMPVIGYFSGRSPEAEAPIRVPFLKALEGSGFTVERNIAIADELQHGS
jgi:putative ABC transport system substrate-binding protein